MEKYSLDFLKILADNVKAIVRGNYEEGVTDLNTLGNLALLRIDRGTVTPSVRKLPRLSAKQRRQVRRFYRPYVRFMTTRYHRLYTAVSGRFYPEYIPAEFFAMQIDRYYNDREAARYLDNKCYYYSLFANIRQPELIAMRIGGVWLDGRQKVIGQEAAYALLQGEAEAVVKKAVNSEGGYGVTFLNGENIVSEFRALMEKIEGDVVVQRPVRQHEALAALHPQSVNTIRIVSLMTGDKVRIYAAALKIGTGEARTDNKWQGGIYCGVRPDGSLRDYGVQASRNILTRHPDLGYNFAGKKVPCFSNALKLVREAHALMGHFRLLAWDVAIDETGEAVLIETNLSLGGINNVQMCCGPLFGRDTKKILDEVMQGRRKVTTLL